ncbi:MAG TPA: hypothetical protein PL143_03390 [Rhodocyclaceae bacterium]|nr:hypothetical protein [Rhodocyclaceae bacterium]
MNGATRELPERFHELVEFAMLATPVDPFDPMEKAVGAFGRRWLAGTEHVCATCRATRLYRSGPRSSEWPHAACA